MNRLAFGCAAALLTLTFGGVAEAGKYDGPCRHNAIVCTHHGGTDAVCFGKAYAQCKVSGVYVGPYSGQSFSAGSTVPRR